MLKQKYLTLENGLYALIFLLGVTLRLLNLGVVPLSDAEADLAMRALAIARGAPVTVGVQPGYTLLTGFLFYPRAAFPALKRRQEWKKGHIMKQNQRRKLWKSRSC